MMEDEPLVARVGGHGRGLVTRKNQKGSPWA